MKIALRVVGGLLFAFGLIWVIAITGGVFSHGQGYTNFNDLWGGFAFHTICMFLGALGLTYGKTAKAIASPAQA